jgi:hypothetical protein
VECQHAGVKVAWQGDSGPQPGDKEVKIKVRVTADGEPTQREAVVVARFEKCARKQLPFVVRWRVAERVETTPRAAFVVQRADGRTAPLTLSAFTPLEEPLTIDRVSFEPESRGLSATLHVESPTRVRIELAAERLEVMRLERIQLVLHCSAPEAKEIRVPLLLQSAPSPTKSSRGSNDDVSTPPK